MVVVVIVVLLLVAAAVWSVMWSWRQVCWPYCCGTKGFISPTLKDIKESCSKHNMGYRFDTSLEGFTRTSSLSLSSLLSLSSSSLPSSPLSSLWS